MITEFLNTLIPEDCLACGQEGSLWCDWCRMEPDIVPSRCYRCFAATDNFEVCKKCRASTPLRSVAVVYKYDGYAKMLVRAMKYSARRQAVVPIAKTLSETLPFYPADTVFVNVPTASARVRQRGFDHTAQIAKLLAKERGLEFWPVLVKLDNNRQVGATRQQRIKQAQNAYRLKKRFSVEGKHIVLVDDIITTGASLEAAYRVLKTAGAMRIDCAVFAYSR